MMSGVDMSKRKQASTGKMISYSFGNLTGFFLGNVYTLYIFYFYEVEIGLAAGLVALSLIIFAIWNMVNDPLFGYLTDKPFKWTRRWGMRFPWIIFSVVPTLIFFLLVFTPPNIDAKVNPLSMFLYMIIILCLFDTCYSLFTTHFYGSYAKQFPSDSERRKAAIFNTIIPHIGFVFIGFIPPLIIVYGDKNSFFLAMLIVAIILSICVIVSIPGITESEELKETFLRGYETVERTSFWKTMKIAFRHKNYVIAIITATLYSAAWNLYIASGIYFMKDILRLSLSYILLINFAQFLGFCGFIPFWAWVAKKIGHVKTYTLGCLLVSITLTPVLWVTTLWEAMFYNFIGGIGFGAFYIMGSPISSDCYDEIAVTTGKRQEAVLSGIRTFFLRIAIIVSALTIATVHIITAYNPNPNAIQTPLAQLGIRIHMGLIPCLLALMAFIIMLLFYDLKGEKKEQMIKNLHEKKL